jgi:hypothetical protein
MVHLIGQSDQAKAPALCAKGLALQLRCPGAHPRIAARPLNWRCSAAGAHDLHAGS